MSETAQFKKKRVNGCRTVNISILLLWVLLSI